ncbi:aspartate 1-decarboxylase [Opitutus sp. ER46]|uniref:aspartate 1-decarboxylase n=1 Tax=Opitutus sp. ER46 TaxID=2161864 RepID=UPI000D3163D8|nr:aspartate 1-decarboxylase [Opitutus sp. ER46]PTX91769.1 aspartate 1-decarboxylase [Opitutus sp. ER46]
MQLTLLKSKLHRATVTAADLHYEGSIALGPDLRAAAGLLEFERVEIYNVTNGARFATYVIAGRSRGEVMLNGAAARLVQPGDHVIIAAYAQFTPEEAAKHQPTVVLLDAKNRPKQKRAPARE